MNAAPLLSDPGFIAAAFGYLGYLIAADKIFNKYINAPKINQAAFIIICFAFALFININAQLFSVPYIICAAAQQGLFITILMLFFNGQASKKLYLGLLSIFIYTVVLTLIESLASVFVLIFQHTAYPEEAARISGEQNTVIAAVSYGAVIIAVLFVKPKLNLSHNYGAAAVLPAFIIAVFDIANHGATIGIMLKSGGAPGSYGDQIFSHIGFAALAVLSLIAVKVYFKLTDKIYSEQIKIQKYNAEIELYKTITEQYGHTERLRHDMKNHIIALTAMYKNREWHNLGAYLDKLNEFGVRQNEECSGCVSVDALLYQKKKIAEANGINWECDICIPKELREFEFDLCVIIGNLLDNACAAAKTVLKSHAFIRVCCAETKNYYLIEIQNSTVLKDVPKKTGTGLANAKDAARRLKGELSVNNSGGVFTASALIALNSADYNDKTSV